MVAVAQNNSTLVDRNVPEFRKGVHRSDLPVLPPAEARRREVGVGAPASGRNRAEQPTPAGIVNSEQEGEDGSRALCTLSGCC